MVFEQRRGWGTWNLRYEQDVSPILDRNKAAQADSWDRREETRHAAHIPAVVLMEWKNKHGVEHGTLDHKAGVRRLLDDPDYRYLRVRHFMMGSNDARTSLSDRVRHGRATSRPTTSTRSSRQWAVRRAPAPPHRRLRPFLSPALLAAPRWAPPDTFTPTVTGGSGTKTYSYSGPMLSAAGLSFSTTTGTISGTPTTSTLSNIAITVTDGTSSATVLGLSIVISATITLGNLTLSGALQAGTASSGTIGGDLAGSAIMSNLTGLTVNSGARTYTFDGSAAAGSFGNALTETDARATRPATPH
ncbi:hypothetical protein AB5I41_31530 [Sphingomonas sp. MMS24-JH45]